MKRAHSDSSWGDNVWGAEGRGFRDYTANQHREEAGHKLWNLLVSEYASHEITAKLVCSIAHYVTLCGGQGVADLAADPSKSGESNASQHLKLTLAKHFKDPDVYNVGTPSYEKKTSHRCIQQIPMILPSMIFKERFANHVEPGDSTEPLESRAMYECDKSDNHPVVLLSKAQRHHWSRLMVCALYWDGVQYTKRDTFHSLYIINLRTREKDMVFIVSSNLNFELDLLVYPKLPLCIERFSINCY